MRSEIVDETRGTEDLTLGPAMSRSTAVGAVERGIALAGELADDRIGIVGVGEMGIGNTSSASALVAALLAVDPSGCADPGPTSTARASLAKVHAVHRGLAANGLPRRDADPIDVLAAVGGLEVAFLVGVCLGSAARRVPVMLDGFITGAAALAANRLQPRPPHRRSPRPGRPSPATCSCWRRSASSRCSTSGSGSAKARVRRSRWVARRSRS